LDIKAVNKKGQEKLQIMEVENLYSLSDIIRMNKLRRMTWTGHAARMNT
jgi:hypothetical protein